MPARNLATALNRSAQNKSLGGVRRYGAGERPTLSSESAFHAAMLEDPNNLDMPRVYADYLDDNGQSGLAAVIRRHVEEHPENVAWQESSGGNPLLLVNFSPSRHASRRLTAHVSHATAHPEVGKDLIRAYLPDANSESGVFHFAAWLPRHESIPALQDLRRNGFDLTATPGNSDPAVHGLLKEATADHPHQYAADTAADGQPPTTGLGGPITPKPPRQPPAGVPITGGGNGVYIGGTDKSPPRVGNLAPPKPDPPPAPDVPVVTGPLNGGPAGLPAGVYVSNQKPPSKGGIGPETDRTDRKKFPTFQGRDGPANFGKPPPAPVLPKAPPPPGYGPQPPGLVAEAGPQPAPKPPVAPGPFEAAKGLGDALNALPRPGGAAAKLPPVQPPARTPPRLTPTPRTGPPGLPPGRPPGVPQQQMPQPQQTPPGARGQAGAEAGAAVGGFIDRNLPGLNPLGGLGIGPDHSKTLGDLGRHAGNVVDRAPKWTPTGILRDALGGLFKKARGNSSTLARSYARLRGQLEYQTALDAAAGSRQGWHDAPPGGLYPSDDLLGLARHFAKAGDPRAEIVQAHADMMDDLSENPAMEHIGSTNAAKLLGHGRVPLPDGTHLTVRPYGHYEYQGVHAVQMAWEPGGEQMPYSAHLSPQEARALADKFAAADAGVGARLHGMLDEAEARGGPRHYGRRLAVGLRRYAAGDSEPLQPDDDGPLPPPDATPYPPMRSTADAMLAEIPLSHWKPHRAGFASPRFIAADALRDVGRDAEADVLQDPSRHAYLQDGRVHDAAEISAERESAAQRPGHGFAADLPSDERQLLETALWSSTGDDGEPLDQDGDRTAHDIHPDTLASMIADWRHFRHANAHLIGDDPQGNAPHHFWLSRNGHGTGFFDHGDRYGDEVAQYLHDAAHAHGEYDLYVGDDGMIHGSYEAAPHPRGDGPTHFARQVKAACYAAYRAPAGGIVARGTFYAPGTMIPDMQGAFMNPGKPAKKSAVSTQPASPLLLPPKSSGVADDAQPARFSVDKMAGLKRRWKWRRKPASSKEAGTGEQSPVMGFARAMGRVRRYAAEQPVKPMRLQIEDILPDKENMEVAVHSIKSGRPSEDKSPVKVVKLRGGKFALTDGHHRLLQAILGGECEIDAHVDREVTKPYTKGLMKLEYPDDDDLYGLSESLENGWELRKMRGRR